MKEIVLILKKAIVPEDEPQDDQNAFLKAVRLWLQTLADMVENKDHATLPETHLDDRLKQRVDSAWGMGGLMNEDEERENVILNWLTGTVRSLKISSKFDNIDQVLKQADQSTATASRRINAYEVVRFILLAITFSVGIYYSYGPKFVGEFMEMLGIFLFTVSLDMTVDNIQQLKPKSA